ncbi:hypothetical protein [Schauerella aestuarii]|uniref:hypothetical protein n=1 Tax=Schauerella aestuarii TaxID=2511204 RepID=UPI00136F9CEE|nr:hypothetical protein [Achromobacter aestuarii]MYZ44184.1 hypothetical protein [Achromobacter aestuarii]
MISEALLKLEALRRPCLVRALERRWPGCNAHMKRNVASNTFQLEYNRRSPAGESGEISAFEAGWEEALREARNMLAALSPFEDGEKRHQAAMRRAQAARSELEGLFEKEPE